MSPHASEYNRRKKKRAEQEAMRTLVSEARIDSNGRITLFKPFRKMLDANEGDFITMQLSGKSIIITKSYENETSMINQSLNDFKEQVSYIDNEEFKELLLKKIDDIERDIEREILKKGDKKDAE